MKIIWVKDGNKGHEKQVKVLLSELSKDINFKIIEDHDHSRSFKRILDIVHHLTYYFFKFKQTFKNFRDINHNEITLVIGAGRSSHMRILSIKNFFKKINNNNIFTISVLTPSIFRNNFDLICAPLHDRDKLKGLKKVLFFEGSLAQVSDLEPDEQIGLIGLGGINKHFIFNENDLIKQIEYILSLYQNKQWYIFVSRRTPEIMIQKINQLKKIYENISISAEGFDEIIKQASIKVITQDSVNMVYESLSSKGKTILFNMRYQKENKVVKQIKKLLSTNQVGFIKKTKMSDDLSKTKIIMPNKFNEVFCEVEKLSFEIIKFLNLK
tara:strand:- start:121 stop:1095 length:975 start_codon:yes stop_codon:yes gene_type:complete